MKTLVVRLGRKQIASVLYVMACLCAAAAQAGPLYTITDLGTLGGTGSYAYGINTSGQVAGYSTVTGDAAIRAFRYSSLILTDLGTLTGWTSSTGKGINNSGQVVGLAHTLGGSDNSPRGERPPIPPSSRKWQILGH